VTETVFARAGLGRTLVNAVLVQDFPVVQAIVALTSVLTIAILFLSDGVCARLDPRIRME
jgi:peptide/nickel transport system permease protein